MRVVLCERPGPPSVLKVVEQPAPKPSPGQVIVAVACAAITFIETQVRAGMVPPRRRCHLPPRPWQRRRRNRGRNRFDVDPSWLGEKVVTTTGGSGGYAECAVAWAEDLHRIPAGLDVQQAAALLADGRTALALSRAARIQPGDRVLITAAAGGVGSLLVQLARAAGAATVIGLAGGEQKLALARSLGAHVTLDYRLPGWQHAAKRAIHNLGVDIAFDGVGGATGKAVVDLLRPGGRYLPHGMASGAFYDISPEKAQEIETIPLRSSISGPKESYVLVEEVLRLAALGHIRPVIGQIFP